MIIITTEKYTEISRLRRLVLPSDSETPPSHPPFPTPNPRNLAASPPLSVPSPAAGGNSSNRSSSSRGRGCSREPAAAAEASPRRQRSGHLCEQNGGVVEDIGDTDLSVMLERQEPANQVLGKLSVANGMQGFCFIGNMMQVFHLIANGI